jgi:hypothetical protein
MDFRAAPSAANMPGKFSRPVQSHCSAGFIGAGMFFFNVISRTQILTGIHHK